MIILGTNSIKDTGFDVANSLRFNSGSSDYLNNTSVDPVTNRLKFTISLWVKRSTLGAKSMIGTVGGDSSNFGAIWFDSSDRLNCTEGSGGGTLNFITNRVFRDVSAWYNIILAIDTTQGTESNRVKIYVGGVQETSFSTSTYPSQNSNMHLNRGGKTQYIGRHTDSSNNYYFDGYMTEVVWVDGSQEAVTSFGEFDSDSGIWKPIDVSGLTFGNNGFYLDFEDSSALGNDAAGSNNFTVNNLTAIDQSTDTCTNNSATIGTLFMALNTPTFSEGNLQSYSSAAGLSVIPSSIGLASGKWYAELKYAATSSNDNTGIGITMDPASSNQENTEQGGYTFGYAASTGGYTPYQANQSGSGPTYTVGNIMGIYMDLDNMKLYFSKNGTLNSSTGLTINVSNTGFYYFCVQDYTSTSNFWTWQWNFGAGCPFAISSGNTDANGYGNFEYSPTITGDGASKDFFACNTKNLSEYG